MSKSLLLMFCILTGLLIVACAKSAETNRNLAPSSSSTPATVSTGDTVGVAECDNFIAAYENCVSSKVPEAQRAVMRNTVATWRADWKKLAADPQTRAQLAAACTRQREATAASMKAVGCTL